jgi:adenylate cyclase
MSSVPIYILAARSRFPLAWCFVALVLDVLAMSENKFFWLWRPEMFFQVPFVMAVRYGEILSFFTLFAIYVLPLSRRFIVWSCAFGIAVWCAGVANAFLAYGSSVLYWGPFGPGIGDSGLRAIMKPNVLVGDIFLLQVLLAVAFSGFLAGAIGQGRRFVASRVAAQAESNFLKRFFPADVVAVLGKNGAHALEPAHRRIAVLFFADGAGRRTFEEDERNLGRVQASVFAHGGTMDRFTGGPFMASFGVLDDDPSCAKKALACACELVRGSSARAALHAGTAVCGDIGGTHGRTFSVVGDVVNTARRMLDAALARGDRLLVSSDFLAVLPTRTDAEDFEEVGDVELRGRERAVELWKLAR